MSWAATGVVAGYDPGRPVVDGVSVEIHPGETVGLAGPSGCGKSTLARVLGLLHQPSAGTVTVDGQAVRGSRHRAPRQLRTRIGVVFQQPRLAADPRMTLRAIVAEPSRAAGVSTWVDELADLVGLTPDLLGRRPHEVSDGQLQRACVARALALRPAWLVCDEMTTMLDASTTAALVGVIRDYQEERGAGVLAISHDETLLDRWADHLLRLAPGGTIRSSSTRRPA